MVAADEVAVGVEDAVGLFVGCVVGDEVGVWVD
jgi:hypothetical protein